MILSWTVPGFKRVGLHYIDFAKATPAGSIACRSLDPQFCENRRFSDEPGL